MIHYVRMSTRLVYLRMRSAFMFFWAFLPLRRHHSICMHLIRAGLIRKNKLLSFFQKIVCAWVDCLRVWLSEIRMVDGTVRNVNGLKVVSQHKIAIVYLDR